MPAEITTTMLTSKFLEILRDNRANHRSEFEKALAEYREAVIKELEILLQRAREGSKVYIQSQLILPQDQTGSYDRVIAMFEMTTSDTVTLNEEDFSSFVLDEWSWKRRFRETSASNRSYSASLRR